MKNVIALGLVIIYFVFFLQHESLSQKHNVYLISGQGSDYRIFNKLSLPQPFDTIHVKHLVPIKNESLKQYSTRISRQFDTTKNFSIIGKSGGV